MTTLNFNDLEFEVLDTLVAKRYAKFLEANIHEAEQFYFMGESEQQVKDEIDKIVYMLGKEPTENLNKLHEYFADNEDETEMTRLNNLIHYLELIQGEFPPRWGMMTKPGSNAEMELFPKDYTEFTLERKPGYLYINYAHVGKHFAEIAHTADWNIKPEQYVPQYLARPSFHIWLGDYINPDMIPAFQGKLHFAHRKLKEKLNLPELNDPSIRIGYIPFAKITGDINNNDLVGHLLKHKLNKEHMELFKND
mgnify:CR=1 FL=1|tara:strand:- start:377 stop:1129 length:753 start_codon:yes stop_codon:yes gene_type:complete